MRRVWHSPHASHPTGRQHPTPQHSRTSHVSLALHGSSYQLLCLCSSCSRVITAPMKCQVRNHMTGCDCFVHYVHVQLVVGAAAVLTFLHVVYLSYSQHCRPLQPTGRQPHCHQEWRPGQDVSSSRTSGTSTLHTSTYAQQQTTSATNTTSQRELCSTVPPSIQQPAWFVNTNKATF